MEKVGVLAIQGDFAEHCQVFRNLGIDAVEVRLPKHLDTVDGLVIPGGESTTITKLMDIYGLSAIIKERVACGMPLWGTCAGMIVVSHHVLGDCIEPLDLIDMDVRRNAFGRQIDSFEADLTVSYLDGGPFHAVFIRAPWIERIGPDVELVTKLENGTPVAARQNNVLVTAFHPELTQDYRFHQLFLEFAIVGK